MSSKIMVKFMFDKEKKRVAFVEVGSDFIDVLFSFLTLPLGTIVRLLDEQTGLGSLDNVYQSVEKLDDMDLRTDECKKMLLNPRSAAAELCEDLKIKNIHDADPRDFYVCYENDYLIKSTCHYTYVPNTPCCNCGKQMEGCWFWGKKQSDKRGIFVNERTNFLIADYLQVIPTSLLRAFSLLKELKINDSSILEEKTKEFGTEEVLNLLKRSFVSKNPLTEVCLSNTSVQESLNLPLSIKEEEETNDNQAENEITVKLFLNKQTNSVIFIEVGKDFVNQLLSFLTIPLGSVFSLLSDNAHILGGCISNLYSLVENMGIEWCFKSEICRNMLLTPKPSFYGIDKQLLNLEEIASKFFLVSMGCPKCFSDNGYKPLALAPCMHGVTQSKVLEHDPKSRNVTTNSGGAFVVDSRMFTVSDNLHIFSLSICSAVKNYETNFPVNDLVEKDVCLDKAKPLLLLSTMLISKTVLTDIFVLSLSQIEEAIIDSVAFEYQNILCPKPKASRTILLCLRETNLPFQLVMSSKISIRFMFDKEEKRVVFAQVGRDFDVGISYKEDASFGVFSLR